MKPGFAVLALSSSLALSGWSLSACAQDEEAGAPEAGSAEIADADAVARGRETFVRVGCYQCHGYVAQGGAAGSRLAPDPPPAPAIIAYIRRPAGAMPPYAESVLSDAEVQDIHAYLASLPPPPPLESIAILRDE